jgi:prophage DNA circulation protein
MANETANERMARLSEKMKTLEKSDIEMSEAIKSMNKIISISNGTQSLVDQMRDMRKMVEGFIDEYKAEQQAIKQNAAKWENRFAGIAMSIIQWAIIAYLTIQVTK